MRKCVSVKMLLLILCMTVLTSCKKDMDFSVQFTIVSDSWKIHGDGLSYVAYYDYPGKIHGVEIEVDANESFMNPIQEAAQVDNEKFAVTIKKILPFMSAKYYFRFAIDYGGKRPYFTEPKLLKTEILLPQATTGVVSDVSPNSAKCSGCALSNGNVIVSKGICWSETNNPTIENGVVNGGEGEGEFVCQINGLLPKKVYYVRAFASSQWGTSYGDELSFSTPESPINIVTLSVTDVTETSAVCHASVSASIESNVIERGVCWNTSQAPAIADFHASQGTGGGDYSCLMTGLISGEVYFVRAYAKCGNMIYYGNELQFKASSDSGLPLVKTSSEIIDITFNSATGAGQVTDDGGTAVLERGLCWGTSHSPSTQGLHLSSGQGLGSFTVNMNQLTPNTTYYVRAYAVNDFGTNYGDEVSFKTLSGQSLPTVMTSEITHISLTSGVGGGNVISEGGSPVTERGICWSTTNQPTINDSHLCSGSGAGFFQVTMDGLQNFEKYYVRAYAINSAGVSYGNELDFTTLGMVPEVSTLEVTKITSNSAMAKGQIESSGSTIISEMGFCWAVTANPTVLNNHVTSQSESITFTATITGLSPLTHYYLRAYAKNESGISYGDSVEFTTTD